MSRRNPVTHRYAFFTLCLAFLLLSLCAPLPAAERLGLTGSYRVENAVDLGQNMQVTLRLNLINRDEAAFSAQKLKLNPAMTVEAKAKDMGGVSLPARGRQELTQQILISKDQYEALKKGSSIPLSYEVDGYGRHRNNRTILLTAEKTLKTASAPRSVAASRSAQPKVAAKLKVAAKPLRKKPADGSLPSIINTIAGGGPNNVAALNAPLYHPYAVAADLFGNTYIAAFDANRVYKVDSKGTLTVFAGNGATGYYVMGISGDGGPATQAEIGEPNALAVDDAGNVFISANNVIREVTLDGIIHTVAGNGDYAYGGIPSGDDGPALQATLGGVSAIAVSGSNVYLAEGPNFIVRRFTVGGAIKLVAGNRTEGYSGDGGLATDAQLAGVTGVTVDPAGNIFIGSSVNGVAEDGLIREVTPDGKIWTFATSIYISAGLARTWWSPFSLVALGKEHILATDSQNNVVIEFDGTGPGVIVAGQYGAGGYYPPGAPPPPLEPATQALLYLPAGLAIDYSGDVLVTDYGNQLLRRFTIGDNMLTVAGNGKSSYGGDNGPAVDAVLGNFYGICGGYGCPRVTVDGTGKIILSDSVNSAIRQVDPTTGNITITAGLPMHDYSGYLGDEVPATETLLSWPEGIAYDKDGNLYIADTLNQRVRKVTTDGNIHTIAGNGDQDSYGDNGAATEAALNIPRGVAVDPAGNVFIADRQNCIVRKVDAQTQIITTVAGDSSQLCTYQPSTGDGGPATSATMTNPHAVALDATGNLYIADEGGRIWKVDAKTQIITTFAGNGGWGYNGDEQPAVDASISAMDMVVDGAGNLFFADTRNQRVREVTTDGIIHTVAGTGVQDFSGDGGLAVNATLFTPTGVAGDNAGNLHIFDAGNGRVRSISNVFTPKNTTPLAPVFNITPNPVAFGNHLLFSSGGNSYQLVKISNTGTAPLIINAMDNWIFHQNLGDFFFSLGVGGGWCEFLTHSVTLNPGESCVFEEVFGPQSPGAKSMTYEITDNAPGSPHAVNLTGTALVSLTDPALVISEAADFGSQTVGVASAPQTLTLTNWGANDLAIRWVGVTSDGANDFAVSYGAGTCGYISSSSPAVLALGQSCTVQVTFDPWVTGARSGLFSVISNDPRGPQATRLSGTGLLPPGVLAVVPTGLAYSTWLKSLAYDPAANKLYVANNDTTVTVIDGTSYAPTTINNVGRGVTTLAVNPVTHKVYVTTSDGVSVIDGGSYQVAPISTFGLPDSLDIAVNTKTNKIYVANYDVSMIGIIDGETNNFTGFGPIYPSPGGKLGQSPTSLVVNETTNTIYMANHGSGNVTVVDGAFNNVTHSSVISGVTGANLMALNPSTNKIYVTNRSGTDMTVIDGATKTASTVPAGDMSLGCVVVNPVTNKIYAVNYHYAGSQFPPSTVSVIDGASQTKVTDVPVGQGPACAAIDTVTNEIYVTNAASNSISVIDGNTNATTTVATDASPWSVVVNQNAHVAYVLNQRGGRMGSVFVIPSAKLSAPQIATNPSDQQVSAGATATFTAAATGTPTPTVKWQVSTDGTTYNDIPGETTTTLSFTALASQNGYKYRAMFTNTGGSTPTSAATLTVTLLPLTITANPQTMAYGGTVPTLSYTASPNVTLDTPPVCVSTVNSSSPVGAYPQAISCSGASKTGYSISYVNGDITVTSSTLIVTASNRNKTYGAVTTFAGTEFNTTGLVNGDTVSSVSLSSSGAVATATVGPYNIVPSNAAGTGLSNYNISYTNGTLNVGAASLTVKANDRTKTYGAVTTFAGTEFTTTGLVNSDTVSSVSLSSSGAVATATVGPYNIVPSSAAGTGLSNYNISYTNGTLNVGAANLTVKANDRTKTYGTLTTFAGTEFTTAGLVNGDTVSNASLSSTGAVATATVGPYNIVPSNAAGTGLSNYNIGYVNGTLTVGKALLSVTANNKSQIAGLPIPLLDGMLLGVAAGDAITASYSTTAVQGSPAGPYPITPALNDPNLRLSNYSVTITPGVLTITPAITAQMISPTPGSVLAGTAVTFTWTAGTGVTQYELLVGTTLNGNDLYNSGHTTATSSPVVLVPANALPVYVRLYSLTNGAWTAINYVYTAAGTPTPAVLTSPTPGSTLPGIGVTFRWSTGVGVTQYELLVGTTLNGSDLYNSGSTKATSSPVVVIPANALLVYVRLYSLTNGAWSATNYTFTASGTPSPAVLKSPAPGSTLSGSSVTFSWTAGVGVTQYQLLVGTTLNGSDLYNSGSTKATSSPVVIVPVNGLPVYARLYSLINGVWSATNYTYTAAGTPTPSILLSPSPGSTLTSTSATFKWSTGVGVSQYDIRVGTTLNADDLYESGHTTATSSPIVTLPGGGKTIYVRLYSLTGTVWTAINYTLTGPQ